MMKMIIKKYSNKDIFANSYEDNDNKYNNASFSL